MGIRQYWALREKTAVKAGIILGIAALVFVLGYAVSLGYLNAITGKNYYLKH
ncbi:MAG: hypothetical protein HYV27_10920 [Candidatus Hydrogenedentes bacterium]|nr:hypothetical protein [Candidatus Hydrogenedentota bacterium]